MSGAGSSTIEVEGVPGLRPIVHRTVGDRIVAGTWAFAAAMTRGDVEVRGVNPSFLEIALDIVTLPFPGFATDLLPMALGLASVSDGASMITENIFDGRFSFIQELVRLGAEIRTDGKHAVVRGRERLSAAPVRATDIRAGAGLVIAALCAEGVTDVSHAHHVDRGYPDFVEHLRHLGADVRRVEAPPEPTYSLTAM